MRLKKFQQKYGPWAIGTEASAGIGAEFARQIAAKELNVVLVARRAEKLEALANELQKAHKSASIANATNEIPSLSLIIQQFGN
ncbi:SDR family NAD(P)-dependent oxidoreductase [Chloroflexi bacterium TSY]|nr:SDR family NAD(P)-dependent oxidoreductase [Chloroflexi bacterium TSY]